MFSRDYQCGIYKITNLVNGKIYIGSAIRIDRRFKSHLSQLRGNYHINSHLQNAFNEYGIDNFKFERIENVKDKNKLLEREQYYLDTLLYAQEYIKDKDSRFLELGYNINPTAGSNLGVKYSEASKKKMGEWIRTPEIIEKIRKSNTGQRRSLKTRKLQSKIKKLNPPIGSKNGWSKKIYQYNFDTGELIKIWESSNLIYKELGWTKQIICNNCQLIKNKNNQIIAFKDFIWSYHEISDIETSKNINHIIKKYKYLGTTGNHYRK